MIMGSFNVACSISGVSINPGDKIAFFPLKLTYKEIFVHKGDNFLCSPLDMMTPMAFPIFGEYGDYGYIEDIEDNDNAKLIARHFNVDMYKYGQREVLLQGQDSGMFVHRSIYDYMSTTSKSAWDGGPSCPTYDAQSISELEALFVKEMKEARLASSRDAATAKCIIEEMRHLSDPDILTSKLKWANELIGRPSIYYINTFSSTFRLWDVNKLISIYADRILLGEFKHEIIAFIYFYSNMYATNKIFFPSAIGHQSGHPYVARDIANIALRIANRQIEEQENDR